MPKITAQFAYALEAYGHVTLDVSDLSPATVEAALEAHLPDLNYDDFSDDVESSSGTYVNAVVVGDYPHTYAQDAAVLPVPASLRGESERITWATERAGEAVEAVIAEMLAYEAAQFDGKPDQDLNVSGADLVDAFTGWRARLRDAFRTDRNEPESIVLITLEGGVVQDVSTTRAMPGLTVVTVDYDTDGSERDELTMVQQGDGSWLKAHTCVRPDFEQYVVTYPEMRVATQAQFDNEFGGPHVWPEPPTEAALACEAAGLYVESRSAFNGEPAWFRVLRRLDHQPVGEGAPDREAALRSAADALVQVGSNVHPVLQAALAPHLRFGAPS